MTFLNLIFYMSHFSIFGFVPIAVAQKRDNIVLIKLNETLSHFVFFPDDPPSLSQTTTPSSVSPYYVTDVHAVSVVTVVVLESTFS